MRGKPSEAVVTVMAQGPPSRPGSGGPARGGEGQRCDKQRYVRSFL
jgi:hypothetical protein